VLAEADQLPHRRRVRELVAQRAEDAQCLTLAVVRERVCGVHETPQRLVGVPPGEAADLVLDVAGTGPTAPPRLRRGGGRPLAARFRLGGLAPRPHDPQSRPLVAVPSRRRLVGAAATVVTFRLGLVVRTE